MINLRVSPVERETQAAKRREFKERRQQILDTLTPEQRQLYDEYRNYAMPPGWDKREKR